MKFDKSFWLFIMVVGIGWWVVTEHDTRIEVQKENKQLRQDNKSLSETISKQSLQFNRFNQISLIAYRNGIQADTKAQEKIIEYRTILKKEPVCDPLVPQHIANGLYEYTNELRSSAMHTNTSDIN
ncbi:hypothetical protein [Providencia huaxiensis]|uniref:DUF2570 domain-containing protein n=1 Tax=Providencia huaxiensis TaxID=2027290 RepID=A0A8I2D4S1_9GAMM|nr:hypothetical protein [Providencia huaxiensis]MBQ0266765.1 hypothetical protein [Providencia huaxiensis]